jgi:glycosyltransferase involved in cell wall biosynthesis
MIYAAYFILAFTTVQLLVALVNLLFSQPHPAVAKPGNELVSVLIPARNEEKNIGNLLTDLLNQDYRHLEIILFNDQSTDNTLQIIKQYAQADSRIKYIDSQSLPGGWLGKNFACHSLSEQANGKYFLFVDADVRIGKLIIEKTLGHLIKYELGLLSVFPRQMMKTLAEKMTVPNMNYILLSLLPLILVRKSSKTSLAAANGQFMLFHAKTYRGIKPHESLKDSKVEDIEIAKLLKRRNKKVACLVGSHEISCRMYRTFKEAVNGFSRNVIMFFGKSFIFALFFWLVTTFGFIVVYCSFSLPLFFAWLAVAIFTRIIISVISYQPVFQNLVLAIPQQITMGIFILKAFTKKMKKQYTWKGRNIS